MKSVKPNGKSGTVFTPDWVASIMLGEMGYDGAQTAPVILRRHVMDNSCGTGRLLVPVVHRYCEEYLRDGGLVSGLSDDLSTYIHGIEIDGCAVQVCISALDIAAADHGVHGVRWDIKCADALSITDYDGKMDYVIGNPPYIRVRNLSGMYSSVRSCKFCQSGMADTYLAFFELGIRMLSDTGVLCYVTPSAWMHSSAGSALRRCIHDRRILRSVLDFGHEQIFPGVTTYSMITVLDMRGSENVRTTEYMHGHDMLIRADTRLDDMWIDGKLYMGTEKELTDLRDIICSKRSSPAIVKNGFATLSDKVFITDEHLPSCCIDVVKASTGRWVRAFYPYDSDGHRRAAEDLFRISTVRNYLNAHKAELLKDRGESVCTDWFYYGRTQAIKDVAKWKVAIGNLVSKDGGIKVTAVPPGSGVYGGLYVIDPSGKVDVDAALRCNRFIDYARALRNYKSGGYYWISSGDIKRYLDATIGTEK